MALTLFVAGVELCMQRCIAMSDCAAMNCSRTNWSCTISDDHIDGASASTEDLTWIKPDNSSTRHCERATFMKMLTLHSKEFKCVTASSYRCGPPPTLNNSDIIFKNDRTAFYNCKENFQSCGAVMQSVCDVTRGWSTVDECRRNSWENPMKVILKTWERSLSFPCKQNENIEAQIGMKVENGTAENGDGITRIMFLQDGKAISHLRFGRDVSFHDPQTHNVFMERINRQKKYQLTVYMTKDEIQIKINGSSQIKCYRKSYKSLVPNVLRLHEGTHIMTSINLISGVSQGPSKLICPAGTFTS